MIYGKICCVVKPSVGNPLFFSAVAIGSVAVHYVCGALRAADEHHLGVCVPERQSCSCVEGDATGGG